MTMANNCSKGCVFGYKNDKTRLYVLFYRAQCEKGSGDGSCYQKSVRGFEISLKIQFGFLILKCRQKIIFQLRKEDGMMNWSVEEIDQIEWETFNLKIPTHQFTNKYKLRCFTTFFLRWT